MTRVSASHDSQMHILVLGAGGQIGREIVRAGQRTDVQISAFTHSQLNITDPGAVARAVTARQPDLIVNAAAYTAVDKAESDADAAFQVNCEGARIVADACAQGGVPLVHFSTDYVFDGRKPSPYVETDLTNPLGVYGKSKLAGEQALESSSARYVILRTSWVYASHGHNFVRTMLRLGRERPGLRIVDDQHGCPTAARDAAQAVLRLAPRLIADGDIPPGLYHCAGGGHTTWYGFAREIFRIREEISGERPPDITPVTTSDYPTPCPRPANTVLDCARFQQVFGFALSDWRRSLRAVMGELLQAAEHPPHPAPD